MFEQYNQHHPWIGWALFVTGLILVFGVIAYKVWVAESKSLWPGKENWKSGSNKGHKPKKGIEADNWETGEDQQVDDCFMLTIAKPHRKERVIDRIQFMQGDYGVQAYPLKYLVTISGKYNIYNDWKRRIEIDRGLENGILIEFDHPVKVYHFYVAIVEPRPNTHWGFEEIRIREVRLFGRFWRHEI